MDLEEQYDKIYRYCYFKLHQRETAEDITQETFLRFFENSRYPKSREAMRLLYTIARNLCVDEYRRHKTEHLEEEPEAVDSFAEESMVTRLSVKMALATLDEEERELLLLRYVNEVPMSVISVC